MKELTEQALNAAITNCKWRQNVCGIPICSGNCAPCAHEIEKVLVMPYYVLLPKLEMVKLMKGTVKYITFVAICLSCAAILTPYLEVTSFQDSFTLMLALLALFRTCKDDTDK